MIRIVLLVLLNASALAGLYFATLRADKATIPLTPPAERASTNSNSNQPAPVSPTRIKKTPFEQYSFAVNSPVFLSSRKFATAPPPKAPVKPTGLAVSRISLHGIVLFGGQRKALLKIENQPPKWVLAGETIAGWKIGDIAENSVTLTRQKDLAKILLYQKR